MNIIEGAFLTSNAYIAIVVSRFNYFINEKLLSGAIETLKRVGQVKDKNITVIWVPGAYELPLVANMLANSKNYNAIVALGTIIRGSTSHFDLISSECISSLSAVSIRTMIPVTCGVLTTENVEQAIERAGTKAGNKGTEAALAALEMINVLKLLNE
ncbi:6,7-dimethyl-8-ribityllumazine synthase [Sodalis sp. CWE]|uniref:6,7-dimethyl-8-ribityllumazine synthase n=1 Tax=Sodalis sp. CWE TaxID=2803816 RepID=UPI001C7CEED9|nr:6,7-dimethyl-8-ribityllumazine synthase [Sodalis sp. CWE]MBX4181208.1 6,7-dimethyl-8-ribityllumazine synthase [Sodalis sp. CWE]